MNRNELVQVLDHKARLVAQRRCVCSPQLLDALVEARAGLRVYRSDDFVPEFGRYVLTHNTRRICHSSSDPEGTTWKVMKRAEGFQGGGWKWVECWGSATFEPHEVDLWCELPRGPQ